MAPKGDDFLGMVMKNKEIIVVVKSVLSSTVIGSHSRGRSKLTWLDPVKQGTRDGNIDVINIHNKRFMQH